MYQPTADTNLSQLAVLHYLSEVNDFVQQGCQVTMPLNVLYHGLNQEHTSINK